MLAIKNNIMAQNAARHLGKSYDGLAKSVERLSSGLRINSAKDDAAGLAVRELIRADIAVQDQASRNAQDGISMLQTMEGAMAAMDENLIRMEELAEQAATGSYSSDQRDIMNSEFEEMANEIERIANATAFNNISMLNSSSGSVSIHVGTDTTINVDKVDMTKSGLGIITGTAGYEAVSEYGISTVGDNWLSVDDGGNTENLTLNIQFTDADGDNEDAINVVFAGANGGQDYTLQQVVDAINDKTQNLGNDSDGNSKNYAMASTEFDSVTNKYYLKLSSRTTAMDGATITYDTGANTTSANGLTTIANQTGTGITENNGQDYDGDGILELNEGTGVNIASSAAAAAALTTVKAAIGTKDQARAAFGYKMNRLESTISILDIQRENLQTAESRISDVDVATEMATLTRTQVLSQAGISMLAQANSMPQMALSLLR